VADLTCSIVINTYNRAHYLRKLLPGLNHLVDVDFEVIIVNGPSTDDTEAVLAAYGDRIKKADCPVRNLSVSRNIGISQAAGDLVLFIDDDALPADTSWLKKYVELFSADRQIGASGGKVLQSDTEYIEFNDGATTEYGFQRFDSAVCSTVTPDAKPWIDRVQGCNCAFRRSILNDMGGYDEYFTYYLDETDVCLRMKMAGYTTINLPENAVRHYPARENSGQGKIGHKWHIIARSDTYFALKNSTDPWLKRVFNTLRYAKKKHFYKDFSLYRRTGHFTEKQFHEVRLKWFTGVLSGLWAGLTKKRAFRQFSEPPPFLSFRMPVAKKKMSVALLSQSLPIHENYGGVARYTYDLAKGLHERGHEVHLFCRDEKPIQRVSLDFIIHGISDCEYADNTLFEGKAVLNKNVCYSVAVERRLHEWSMEHGPFDVVQAANWDAEAVAVLKKGDIPVVLTLVTSLAKDIVEMNWEWKDDLKACVALDYWQIMHADVLCIPSTGVLDSYGKLMAVPSERLAQSKKVALGIDPLPEVKKHTSEPSKKKRILFVGRCERRKGVHTLLAVLKKLLPEFPEWECHFIGNDQIPDENGVSYKQAFFEQVGQVSWVERVFFHGFISEEEMLAQYQDCDIFVAPSLFESFGLIYLEAMQFGKPVVGCSVGGVPETVGTSAGILVEPEDPEALQEALARLMKDEALRHKMGQAGRARVQHEMNYKKMAEGYERIFLACL